ncbi:MAG: hypothetical protein C0594_12800, partial [Marinilabiliales bacterium]
MNQLIKPTDMKKILFLICLLPYFSFAQITFTSTDLPAVGDTFLFYIDTNCVVDLGTPSGNQNWDLTGLDEDSASAIAYFDPSGLPFSGDFPTANLCNGDSTGYMFYNVSNSGMEIVGMRAEFPNLMTINFTDPSLLLGTPVTYGSSFTDYSEWEIAYDYNPADMDTFYVSTSNKTLNCDAWGSISTPYGFYDDVLRIKENTINVANLIIELNGSPVYTQEVSRDTVVNYFFITNELHYPVATIKLNPDESEILEIEYMYTPIISNGQIESVSDGNWTTPTTWDCMCIPTPGDEITVSNDVTLDTDFFLTNTLIINNGASLIKDGNERYFATSDASVIVNGKFHTDYLYLGNGTTTINDSLLVNISMFNSSNLSNLGVIAEIDSLFNAGTITNSGEINALNYTSENTFSNSGDCYFENFTNTGVFTNTGFFEFDDMTNLGLFEFQSGTATGNYDFLNSGYVNHAQSASINIGNDFMNSNLDSSIAYYNIEGQMTVLNNWMNFDTIAGINGQITVSNSTGNDGALLGSFDLCDQTPPPSYPFIDINNGVIDPDISFCGTVQIETPVSTNFKIYPNPTSDYINIELENESYFSFELFDIN